MGGDHGPPGLVRETLKAGLLNGEGMPRNVGVSADQRSILLTNWCAILFRFASNAHCISGGLVWNNGVSIYAHVHPKNYKTFVSLIFRANQA